jgi:hypothetical protein
VLRRLKRLSPALFVLLLTACSSLTRCNGPKPLDQAAFNALYNNPEAVKQGPLKVYHIGHSLVGRDMPAMLTQLAGHGHGYERQLGWGTSMREHWEPDAPINGFDVENDHPRYRDATESVASGEYDAFVLTEMVEIRDAIKYHASGDYLHRWAQAAWDANPDVRVYLYETWHPLNDPEGWLTRVDTDLARHWEGDVLRRALAYDDMPHPIYVIPAGQVLAAFVRAIEAESVDGLTERSDLFIDDIHLSDLGLYLVALTHYAVLYQTSPVGLPYALKRADGSPATAPGPDSARLMQKIVWRVVQAYLPAGLP